MTRKELDKHRTFIIRWGLEIANKRLLPFHVKSRKMEKSKWVLQVHGGYKIGTYIEKLDR